MAIGKSGVVSDLAQEGHDQYQLAACVAEWAGYSAEIERGRGGGEGGRSTCGDVLRCASQAARREHKSTRLGGAEGRSKNEAMEETREVKNKQAHDNVKRERSSSSWNPFHFFKYISIFRHLSFFLA